jgi:hypothetical protein
MAIQGCGDKPGIVPQAEQDSGQRMRNYVFLADIDHGLRMLAF